MSHFCRMVQGAAPIFFSDLAGAPALASYALRQAQATNPGRELCQLLAPGERQAKEALAGYPLEGSLAGGAWAQALHTAWPGRVWPMHLLTLAGVMERRGLEAIWWFGTETLIYEKLTWPEETLAEADLATVTDGAGLVGLYIRRAALAPLLAAIGGQSLEAATQDLATELEALAQQAGLAHEPLAQVRSGMVFDMCIGHTEQFRRGDREVKHIVWTGGRPFVVSRASGLVARAVTLRFGPGYTGLLHRYYRGPGLVAETALREARLLLGGGR